MTVLFGPAVTSCEITSPPPEGMEFVSAALQIVTSEEVIELPLFKKVSEQGGWAGTELSSFYFEESVLGNFYYDAPYSYYPSFESFMCEGRRFLTVSSLAASIYQLPGIAIPPTQFWEDFVCDLAIPCRRTTWLDGCLSAEAEEAGLCVTSFMNHGQRISVFLDYVVTKDRWVKGGRRSFSVGPIEFKPSGRKIGTGKWIELNPRCFCYFMQKECAENLPPAPINFFTPEGIARVEAAFDWTKATELTPAELKVARKEFIIRHSNLHSDVYKLADEMVHAGLYAVATSRKQIVRMIQKNLT